MEVEKVNDEYSSMSTEKGCPREKMTKDPIWRGSFIIRNQEFGTLDGLVAHLTSKMCPETAKLASSLPQKLAFQIVPKASVWPLVSDKIPSPEDDFAFYFIPEHESNGSCHSLIGNMFSNNLALKTVVDGNELLVFTSLQLPRESYWRLHEKCFFWGVFVGEKLICQPRQSNSRSQIFSTFMGDKELLQDNDLTTFQQNSGGDSTKSGAQSGSLSICTSILNMARAFPDSDLSSFDNSPKVSGPYFVKPCLQPILDQIFDKYGDIAENCIYESIVMRSTILEGLCETIMQLQEIDFKHFRGCHLKLLSSVLTDCERAKLDVKWLRERYNRLKETVQQIKEYVKLADALAELEMTIESKKTAIDLKKAHKEMLQLEIETSKSELTSLLEKSKQIESNKRDVETKCGRFRVSLVDGLV